MGKSGTLPADNATLGIVEPRLIVNEGMILSGLERIKDPHIRLSLALQQAFGLQPEESIKFQPSYADRSDHIALKRYLDQEKARADGTVDHAGTANGG